MGEERFFKTAKKLFPLLLNDRQTNLSQSLKSEEVKSTKSRGQVNNTKDLLDMDSS